MVKTESNYISKVPAITLGYWVIKILATTLGEVGGNAVTLTLGLGYLIGTVIFTAFLVAAVTAQIRSRRFQSFLYWSAITATTLAGTTLADLLDRSLGLGYLGGSLSLFTMVMSTLALWYWSRGSIAVDTVTGPKVEAFYWATIMFSQTLGTALGDWMADSTGLGYSGSALVIAITLMVIALLYFKTKVSHTALFWAAFILTRPLGATVANSLDKPAAAGGMAIGDFSVSAVLAVVMTICILTIPQRPGRKSKARPSRV